MKPKPAPQASPLPTLPLLVNAKGELVDASGIHHICRCIEDGDVTIPGRPFMSLVARRVNQGPAFDALVEVARAVCASRQSIELALLAREALKLAQEVK